MSAKKKGLGRGLSDLGLGELLSSVKQLQDVKSDQAQPPPSITISSPTISSSPSAPPHSGLQKIDIDLLLPNRYQPRQDIDAESLNELAESIKTQGILQPILVRSIKNSKEYEIIAGERRWRAAQLAGLNSVPIIIKDLSDEQTAAVALIENLQREDLNAIDTAQGLQRLIAEFGMTHQTVATAIGKSRVTVTNLLRLLHLPDIIKQMVQKGELEMGHARALLALSPHQQLRTANVIAAKNLSVRATEDLIHKLLHAPTTATANQKTDPNVTQLQSKLRDLLGTKVKIQYNTKGKGKVVIYYNSLDELDSILTHVD